MIWCIGCHDRRNNIYQLCHAGDLYTICMTEKCDQHTSHKKCILKVINILQLMGKQSFDDWFTAV